MKQLKLGKYDIYSIINLLAVVLVISFRNQVCDYESDIAFFSCFSLIEMIIILLIWNRKVKNMFSPFLIMIIGCYICWFGQVVLRWLNLVKFESQIISGFNTCDFRNTLTYIIIGFACFSTGGTIATTYKKEKMTKLDNKISSKYNEAIFMAGLVLIGISIYPYLYDKINMMKISLQYGYMAIYDSYDVGFIGNLKMFYIPGLFLLITSKKDNKRIRRFLYMLVVVDCSIQFITGGRGMAISLIIALLFFHHVQIKKFEGKKIVALICIAIVLIFFIDVVQEVRGLKNKNFHNIINHIIENKDNGNFVVDVVNEFGANIYPTYWTMKLIPNTQKIAYGYTYFASVMAILPNVFYGGYSFSDKAALAEWLMEKLGLDYGPGYSIIAEGYYNFGFGGIFAMFVIGIILARLYSNNEHVTDKKILRETFIAITIYITLFIARDTTLLILRKIVYMVVFPNVLINCIYGLKTDNKESISNE